MNELEDVYKTINKNQDSRDCKQIIPTFFDSDHFFKLSNDQKNLCEGILTKAECFNALSNGKTLGHDG